VVDALENPRILIANPPEAGRVLFVTSSWPRTGDEIAGTFVRTDAIVRARRPAFVTVAAPRGPGDARDAEGTTIVDVPHGGAFGSPGALARIVERPHRVVGLLPWAHAVRTLARTVSPTHVVAHWIVPSGLLALSLDVASREIIAHGGDVRLLERLPRSIARRILDRVIDGATLRAVSIDLAERIVAIAPRCERRIVIEPMPLDERAIDRARVESRVANLHVVAARLVRAKRIERAIDRARVCDARLVIVGDGPDRERLRAHASRTSTHVQWTGALPHEAALSWIARADRVLAPLGPGEGNPTVVREAQALGVPCEVLA